MQAGSTWHEALPLSKSAYLGHSFNTDRIEQVRSRKTIYVVFDLNDYSIPLPGP
ncbi:MAG TPA: hypothetical protein VKU01_05490 [Bryobacteraceae bacterium]|nr:hypothetical protein [Bryobacteraceae bacterium]